MLAKLVILCQAGFFPGCVYLISCWYKRYEVQTRISFFFMSSVLAAGFSVVSDSSVLNLGDPGLRSFSDSCRRTRWLAMDLPYRGICYDILCYRGLVLPRRLSSKSQISFTR